MNYKGLCVIITDIRAKDPACRLWEPKEQEQS